MTRWENELDPHYAEMYRRATLSNLSGRSKAEKMALDFQKRCKKRGVPMECLRKVLWVRAYRVSGNGSGFLRQQAHVQMQPYVPMLTEEGKQHWLEDMVASLYGQEMVPRYVSPLEKDRVPNDQTAMAMLENAALKIGAPVSWTPTQNNVLHAQVHLQAASAAAASLQQGANPVEVDGFIEAVGAHTAVHLQQLSGDPSRAKEFKALEQQWKELAKLADQLRKKIEEQMKDQQDQQQQQAQAQQQQQMPVEEQLKIQKAQIDMKLKELKAQQILRQKEEKHAQSMALADATTAATMMRNAKTPTNNGTRH